MTGKLNWTLSIYSYVGFTEAQNFVIDDMSQFLSAHTPITTLTNVHPFSPDLDITLRLPLSEEISAILEDRVYIAADSYEGVIAKSHFFYFVHQVKRLANNVCELTLRMDTLNSFGNEIEFTDKTLIVRMHKDRFIKTTAYQGQWPRQLTLANAIDKVSEGIQPRKHIFSESLIQKSASPYVSDNFYLIYQTAQELSAENLANPVSCALCADSQILVSAGTSGAVRTWTSADIPLGAYYYFVYDPTTDNGDGCKVTGAGIGTFTLNTSIGTNDVIKAIVISKSGTNVHLTVIAYNTAYPNEYFVYSPAYDTASLTINQMKGYRYLTYLTNQIGVIQAQTFNQISSGVVGDVKSLAFSSLPRTDSKIMKIIKLPYSPMPVNSSGSGYAVSGFSFDYSSGLFKLPSGSLNTIFENNQLSPISFESYLKTLIPIIVDIDDMLTQSKNQFRDPKLFHSDFSSFKFNYDSFSAAIPLEMAVFSDRTTFPSVQPIFHPTNTINSNFAFKLAPTNFSWDKELDYQDYILSTRNNEITIFSNSYIDYIKTGFNYDKKSKALSSAASWTSAAVSIAAGAASAALSPDAFTKATGIGLLASGFSQIAGAISTTIQNENAMSEKLAQLKAQATSTAGCDDIDLLSYYGSNKLRFSYWTTSNEMISLLSSLFYYYGYACNYQGVPDVKSRCWFNYVQCQPVFTDALPGEMKAAQIDDLKSRFAQGVTYIHHQTLGGSELWGLSQGSENWETWLLD